MSVLLHRRCVVTKTQQAHDGHCSSDPSSSASSMAKLQEHEHLQKQQVCGQVRMSVRFQGILVFTQ